MTPQSLKRLLYALLLSLLLIALFLISKIIFEEDKPLILKSFDTPAKHQNKTSKPLQDKEQEKKMLLLPTKE